jgi:serine protease Do
MDEINRPSAESHSSEPVVPAAGKVTPRAVIDPGRSERSAESTASLGSRRLFWLLAFLVALLVGPYVVGQYVYQATYNELLAGADVAIGALAELQPRLDDLEMASRLIAKRVEPSVVSIFRPTNLGREGQGSGVIVDPEGYIVTNYHVVTGDQDIYVELSDRRRTRGAVVGADAMTDLAVLKIDEPNLIAVEWGDSDKLQVGDLVWALGSPYGLDRSLTFGIVSAKARRSGSYVTRSAYQEYLQTDAAVNPGNSGGPLVNMEGKIVGINAAIFGESYRGISFAIPSSLAQEKYDELRSKGWVDRAWLGVQPLEVPELVRERIGLELGEGVYVGHVRDPSPAERAGIRVGDVILKWNAHEATDPTLLSREIAATEIGSMAKIILARRNQDAQRGVERLELDVNVERAPWAVEASNGQ